MEEILASIRRIISEDDAPAETAPATAAAAPEPAAESAPEPEPSPALMDKTPSVQEPASEEDVLELTDTYETPAAETIGDLDVSAPEPEPAPVVSESAFAPEPAEVAAPEPIPAPSNDGLVGATASATAASAFAGLSSAVRRPEPEEPSTGGGPTIDELTRQLLRPMLKEWLDANLPGIVEAQVRKEVERIARNAG